MTTDLLKKEVDDAQAQRSCKKRRQLNKRCAIAQSKRSWVSCGDVTGSAKSSPKRSHRKPQILMIILLNRVQQQMLRNKPMLCAFLNGKLLIHCRDLMCAIGLSANLVTLVQDLHDKSLLRFGRRVQSRNRMHRAWYITLDGARTMLSGYATVVTKTKIATRSDAA
jgi:hypothetical protein